MSEKLAGVLMLVGGVLAVIGAVHLHDKFFGEPSPAERADTDLLYTFMFKDHVPWLSDDVAVSTPSDDEAAEHYRLHGTPVRGFTPCIVFDRRTGRSWQLGTDGRWSYLKYENPPEAR